MKQNFEIHIARSAQKELGALPQEDYFKVKKAVLKLGSNPRPRGAKKLRNREAWRIRCDNYRIIYEIHKKRLVVLVVKIGHRREIYRSR